MDVEIRRAGKERTRFFRVPRVITNQGELIEELTWERRRGWISAIRRDDLTEGKNENDRFCSKHFVSGEPAKEWGRFNVGCVPTQKLVHHKLRGDPEKVVERANRAAQRRKLETCQQHSSRPAIQPHGYMDRSSFASCGPCQ